MGGASFFGLAVLSGSKLVTVMAIISVLSHMAFLNYVETCVRLVAPLLTSQSAHAQALRRPDALRRGRHAHAEDGRRAQRAA